MALNTNTIDAFLNRDIGLYSFERIKLIEKYPYTSDMLLPTIFIEEDVGDEYFNED